MDTDISNLWRKIMDYGYDVNKKNQNGLQMWQPMKEIYNNTTYLGKVENPLFLNVVNENILMGSDVTELTDVKIVINGITLDNTMEGDHFFIQHFRIPIVSKFNLTLLKLLQIAYNAGQFKAQREKNYYNEKIISFYDANKLDKLETYLNLKY
jgi:hypothetical protein